MGGHTFTTYGTGANIEKALERGQRKCMPEYRLGQKSTAMAVTDTALPLLEAELLADQFLNRCTEKSCVVLNENLPNFLDHFSPVAGAIPVGRTTGGKPIGWLFFGAAND